MSVKVRAPEARVIYMVGLGEGKSYNFVINKRTFRTYEAGRGGIVVLKNPPRGSGKRFLKFKKPIRIDVTAAGERGPSLLDPETEYTTASSPAVRRPSGVAGRKLL